MQQLALKNTTHENYTSFKYYSFTFCSNLIRSKIPQLLSHFYLQLLSYRIINIGRFNFSLVIFHLIF